MKCKKWDLIKDGVLVNYQAIRDQVSLSVKVNHMDVATLKAGVMFSFSGCLMYPYNPGNNSLHPIK